MKSKIYGISDPHLTLSKPEKDMSRFGHQWLNHVEKLKYNWEKTVTEDDIVILPGDISWATRLHEVLPDIKFLNDLPGFKLFSKGNHDYWYSTHRKVDTYLSGNGIDRIISIERNSYNAQGKYIIAGFKGFNYTLPEPDYTNKLNGKSESLNSFLKDLNNLYPNIPIILSVHFPPFEKEKVFINMYEKYNVKICLFGHLHEKINFNDHFKSHDIDFYFVAADYLKFKPRKILKYEF